MVVAGTGHRPDKIVSDGRNAYDDAVALGLMQFVRRCLRRLKPTRVISGMALGWDQALAAAAVWEEIPFDAYVPFAGQESRWPASSQRRYRELLAKAADVVICSPGGYHPGKMQHRNERMVDMCDVLLALWNGTPGGTANCVAYAERSIKEGRALTVHNVWSAWERSRGRLVRTD